jgi:hypothetical protein
MGKSLATDVQATPQQSPAAQERLSFTSNGPKVRPLFAAERAAESMGRSVAGAESSRHRRLVA